MSNAVAVVDVGTNTALLLIAERRDGQLATVHTDRRVVRLGEGVDRTRRISHAAMDRLEHALADYVEACAARRVSRIHVVGTSAARDAENNDELRERISGRFGIDFTILSGEQEGRFSFQGAVAGLATRSTSIVVVDIGGGSTELVLGDPVGPTVRDKRSLDIGTVRLTERCVSRQPIPPTDQGRVVDLVVKALAGAEKELPRDTELVGVAGTVSTLARLNYGITYWEELSEDSIVLSFDDVSMWQEKLARLTFDEVLSLNPTILDGRADVIPVGASILKEVMRHYQFDECLVSKYSLRHGVALSLLDGKMLRNNRS